MLLNTDYDECSHGDWNDCNDQAECNNTIGSYDCKCNVGYTGDGRRCEGAFHNDCIVCARLLPVCVNTPALTHACTRKTTTRRQVKPSQSGTLIHMLHTQGSPVKLSPENGRKHPYVLTLHDRAHACTPTITLAYAHNHILLRVGIYMQAGTFIAAFQASVDLRF